jgi:hypothetical protein
MKIIEHKINQSIDGLTSNDWTRIIDFTCYMKTNFYLSMRTNK